MAMITMSLQVARMAQWNSRIMACGGVVRYAKSTICC